MPEASGTTSTGGTKRARPVHRNISVGEILQYRLPLPGIVSILHRVSGALLFLVGIPLTLYLLQMSLSSAEGFATFEALAGNVLVKLVLLVLFWAFFHHLCAGIRYLVLDLHIGTEKEQAIQSSKIVFGATAVLTLIAAAKLFGAF
ncbi:MAG: succinate dehydrogenase, cytochrome b556 subunit [Burkholderiaceae bacterium]